MEGVLRVLVVDDSAYVRKVVREMLSRSPFLEVVGAARNGVEGLELARQLEPHVVTCDLIMPELDGVGFVREQMRRKPLPIIIMSIANENAEAVLNALDAGAVDFVQKPTALATDKIFEVSSQLIEKVKAAGGIALDRLPKPTPNGNDPVVKAVERAVTVGNRSVHAGPTSDHQGVDGTDHVADRRRGELQPAVGAHGAASGGHDLGAVADCGQEPGCAGEHLEGPGDVEDLPRVEGHDDDVTLVRHSVSRLVNRGLGRAGHRLSMA